MKYHGFAANYWILCKFAKLTKLESRYRLLPSQGHFKDATLSAVVGILEQVSSILTASHHQSNGEGVGGQLDWVGREGRELLEHEDQEGGVELEREDGEGGGEVEHEHGERDGEVDLEDGQAGVLPQPEDGQAGQAGQAGGKYIADI